MVNGTDIPELHQCDGVEDMADGLSAQALLHIENLQGAMQFAHNDCGASIFMVGVFPKGEDGSARVMSLGVACECNACKARGDDVLRSILKTTLEVSRKHGDAVAAEHAAHNELTIKLEG